MGTITEPVTPPASSLTSPISLAMAVMPLLVMAVVFGAGSLFMAAGTELLVASLLVAAAVAGSVAVWRGSTWDAIVATTGEKLAAVLPAVLILLTIGMLVGSWIASGTIPLMIWVGLSVVNPEHLVVTAFLATAVMSLCTGTSWGSAGTIGVALMGMAVAVDAPLAPTAGAVVSGAYFGDKLSPLSDTTNICAIGAGADLYRHIRHMLYTAVPSFVIATAVYSLAAGGGTSSGGLGPDASRLLADIEVVFDPTLAAGLPPLVVIAGIVTRRPPVLAMVASSLVAMIVGIGAHGFGLEVAIKAAIVGFDVDLLAGDLEVDRSLSPMFVKLLARGGLYSMVDTLVVILAAFLFAAAMERAGALDRIIGAMLSAVRSVFGVVAASMGAGTLVISLTSHGGVTALIVGDLFQAPYRDHGLAPENLSRSLEDSVTIVEPLLPWTVSAMFMAKTLGVATVSYAPWALFCLGGPVFSLLYAATFRRLGVGLRPVTNSTQSREPQGSG